MAWTPPGLGVRHVTLEQVGITFIGPPVSERVLDCVVPGRPRTTEAVETIEPVS